MHRGQRALVVVGVIAAYVIALVFLAPVIGMIAFLDCDARCNSPGGYEEVLQPYRIAAFVGGALIFVCGAVLGSPRPGLASTHSDTTLCRS
jgi:hypothetical protein